jgi:hypothetical protein
VVYIHDACEILVFSLEPTTFLSRRSLWAMKVAFGFW